VGHKSEYQDKLEKLLIKFGPELSVKFEVTYKNCFGAIVGYVDEEIFCSLGKFGFALKLPQSELNKLFEKGCESLKYFPKGHIKKDYAVISSSILKNKVKMQDLIKKSVKFATQ
jgi:TfoX/Sxy family transcriptional regulator of competence genes